MKQAFECGPLACGDIDMVALVLGRDTVRRQNAFFNR
jgi:hypothetical protein